MYPLLVVRHSNICMLPRVWLLVSQMQVLCVEFRVYIISLSIVTKSQLRISADVVKSNEATVSYWHHALLLISATIVPYFHTTICATFQ